MARKLIVLCCIGVVGMASPLATGAAQAAGPSGAACMMSGTATLNAPYAKVQPQTVSYTFSGTLTKCQSSVKGVTSGKIAATGKGTIACEASKSTGTATVTWNNGKTTTISYTAVGAGALVAVQSSKISGQFAGTTPARGAESTLVITKASPNLQACSSTGVRSFSFTGQSGIGSAA
jgi:hypothetical protein